MKRSHTLSASILSVYSLAIATILAAGCSTTHAIPQSSVLHTSVLHSQSGISRYFEKSSPESRTAFKTTSDIQAESSRSKQLSLAQIDTLDKHVNDSNMLVRVMVMSALMNAGSAHASAAAVVVRKGLAATDSPTRVWALRDLDYLNAPDIIPVAKEMLTNRSQAVANEARTILSRRGVSY